MHSHCQQTPKSSSLTVLLIRSLWQVPLLMPNKFGARSIHTAAREGHVSVVNTLIKKGESVDARTGDGLTALHIAVECGKVHNKKV